MRDLVLREGLKTMSGDAALCLRDVLAAGQEIPYEVREAGSGSLAEYVPQTSRFIRDHASELTGLDSFGSACAALESAGLAGPYLAEMGVPEPDEARRRGELAGIVFLCRLWQGSTDFTLDDARLETTMDELLELGEVTSDEVEIAVPLRGFQMDGERVELAGATIVNADVVDVPAEARSGEGMGGAAWEPTFLAVARVDALGGDGESPDLGVRAVGAFRRVITTLQLFKAGGVALGPHAWIRAGGDRWRRIATGAGKPRPGGYRLAAGELPQLAGFSRALMGPDTPFTRIDDDRKGFPAALGRALSRFQAGLERPVTLEALNDHLLTLRFLLEGGGPASLGMPMRVAALCAEPDGRTDVKATVDHAMALERELWSGEPSENGERRPPAEVAAEVEDLTRAILGDAACGHLGGELRITADEILLGDGLSVGEGGAPDTRGETAEWGAAATARPDAIDASEPDFEEIDLDSELRQAVPEPGAQPEPGAAPAEEHAEEPAPEPEPVKAPGNEFSVVRAQNLIHDIGTVEPDFDWEEPMPNAERRDDAEREPVTPRAEPEIPSGDEAGGAPALRLVPEEGPVAELIADSDQHRRDVASRVSFLFPPPETTEWGVREVGYDRRRRAEIDHAS